MLCILCVAYLPVLIVSALYVMSFTHALVLQWACVLVPTVTVVCTDVLSYGWLFLIMRVLWLVIIDLTLLMQL